MESDMRPRGLALGARARRLGGAPIARGRLENWLEVRAHPVVDCGLEHCLECRRGLEIVLGLRLLVISFDTPVSQHCRVLHLQDRRGKPSHGVGSRQALDGRLVVGLVPFVTSSQRCEVRHRTRQRWENRAALLTRQAVSPRHAAVALHARRTRKALVNVTEDILSRHGVDAVGTAVERRCLTSSMLNIRPGWSKLRLSKRLEQTRWFRSKRTTVAN